MRTEIPSFLLSKSCRHLANITDRTSRAPFLDKGIYHLAKLVKITYIQWETASRHGFFQNLDARIKVFFLLFFVLIVSLKRSLVPEVIIGGFVFILTVVSRLNPLSFYKKVLFFGFIFGFLIALPSALNIIIDGEVVIPIAHLPKPYDFWIYHIPATVGLTRPGLEGVAMLTLRVMNSLSLSFLVIYTTPFAKIIKALKSLKVPDAFLMIMTLSYKYIFIFAQTLEDIYLAKKSKIVEESAAGTRNWVTGRIAFLFRKTQTRCEEVYNGMLARGFSGDVVLYTHTKMTKKDIIAGSCLFIAGFLLLLL